MILRQAFLTCTALTGCRVLRYHRQSWGGLLSIHSLPRQLLSHRWGRWGLVCQHGLVSAALLLAWVCLWNCAFLNAELHRFSFDVWLHLWVGNATQSSWSRHWSIHFIKSTWWQVGIWWGLSLCRAISAGFIQFLRTQEYFNGTAYTLQPDLYVLLPTSNTLHDWAITCVVSG